MVEHCENRERIERQVVETPAISFTELKEQIGLENGVIQHHITASDRIERRNTVLVPKGYCKDCSLSDNCVETCHRRVLRDPLKRRILEGLRDGVTQEWIAQQEDLDPSTISYHVDSLETDGLLDSKTVVDTVCDVLDAE